MIPESHNIITLSVYIVKDLFLEGWIRVRVEFVGGFFRPLAFSANNTCYPTLLLPVGWALAHAVF